MSKLSTRLEMVASLVPNGVNCGDIGADHGYLIINLITSNRIIKGYACENKIGPYSRLKNNVSSANLLNKISVDLSSGIRTIPNDINCVIIAGMGGDTVCSIINESLDKLVNIDYFIVSSHSKMDEVRYLLTKLGYYIENEKTCFDMNQFYECTLFKKGRKNYSEIELKYGPILLKNKDENLINKLKEKVIFNQKLMKNDNIPIKRLDSISKENNKINEILKILE